MKANEEPPADVKATLAAMNRPESIGSGPILRCALFLAIVLITLTISIPLWGGAAIDAAMSAGSGARGSTFIIIPIAGLVVITISALVIFRKKK